ncbi:MAG: DUF309 domain-containing protein [Planctomycetaceae bacterium]|nr:DUF309 domain-containing protein [Planctomycetaceae bacterium]
MKQRFSLPPYTYVPGQSPHPVSDADGHMASTQTEQEQAGHASSSSHADAHYEDGRRLFDAGYYWEAHEAWEHHWISLGRRGPAADTIKGLIKLAAAGVKVLEGSRTGAERHATRAQTLLSDPTSASASQAGDTAAALQVAARFLQQPFVLTEFDPWNPAALPGWRLRSEQRA